MTDFTPSEADELVSAYLDNEATAEERVQVESSPALMAKVQTFQAVAAQTAVPVNQPSPETRSAHIAAAMKEATWTASNVTSMATASATSSAARSTSSGSSKQAADRKRNFGMVAALGVAAAMLVVLAIGFTKIDLGGDDTTTAAEVSANPERERFEGDDGAMAGDTGGDDDGSGESAEAMASEAMGDTPESDISRTDAALSIAGEDQAQSEADDGAMEEESAMAEESDMGSDPAADAAADDAMQEDGDSFTASEPQPTESPALNRSIILEPQELPGAGTIDDLDQALQDVLLAPKAPEETEPVAESSDEDSAQPQCLFALNALLGSIVDGDTTSLLSVWSSSVNEEPVEAFVFGTNAGEPTRFVVLATNRDCARLANQAFSFS